MSSLRHVQVGGRWEPPPPATGLDPDACASAHEWREVLQQLAAAAPPDRAPTLQQLMVRGFRGVSPQLARDIALAAGVPPDALPADLAAEQWAALHEQWQVWLQRLASGSFAPSCCPTTGAYSLLGAQPQAVPALLPFLSAYYTAEQRAEQFGGVKQQVARAVAAAIARLDKKIESLQRQGGEGDKHQQIQKAADMIMASLHRWVSGGGAGRQGLPPNSEGHCSAAMACASTRRARGRLRPALCRCRIPVGAAAVEVEDWDTDALVALRLDPHKTAVENAEALYKQVGEKGGGRAGQGQARSMAVGCSAATTHCMPHAALPAGPQAAAGRGAGGAAAGCRAV